jgi:hypothetical protein
VLIMADAKRTPRNTPAKRPGFLETLRQSGRPPKSIVPPGGVGPKGKGGRRKPVSASASANGAAPVGTPVGQPELLKQREELSRKFAELQWDLGGMTYEMAARDHYRLDVLNRYAAQLQEVDAELGQVERLLRLGEAGAAGSCPSCGALQARGAVFCWQCGNELKPSATPSQKPATTSSEQPATTPPERPASESPDT